MGERVGARCCVCGRAIWCLAVGVLLLWCLVAVGSLSLFYLSFVSPVVCSRNCCFSELGILHANQASVCLGPHRKWG